MPYSWDHKNLTEIPVNEAKENIDNCLDYFEKNLNGYIADESVCNFAYNASNQELKEYALRRVKAIRTGGWLILNLHGPDDEGWDPVSSKYLDGLLKRMVNIKNLELLPTGKVLKML